MTSIFQTFKAWRAKLLSAPRNTAASAYASGATRQNEYEDTQQAASHNQDLLERSRSQWQLGDWDSLVKLKHDTLQHHPDRAKLALLAAAAQLQTGNIDEARQCIRLAKAWGISKNLLTRILAAGVHNSLGRAAAIAGEHQRALQHFHNSVGTVTPASEAELLVQARMSGQYQLLGLPLAHIGALPSVSPSSPSFIAQSAG